MIPDQGSALSQLHLYPPLTVRTVRFPTSTFWGCLELPQWSVDEYIKQLWKRGGRCVQVTGKGREKGQTQALSQSATGRRMEVEVGEETEQRW